MQFKVGDVVVLKSGGALMTVSRVAEDGSLLCVWQDQTADGWTHKSHVYPAEVLRKHEP